MLETHHDHGHDDHEAEGHAEHGHGGHEHAHDAPGHGHDDHGHGHDEHGHGDRGGVGDYNAEPPGASTLPPVPAWGLALMGAVLALVLGLIVNISLSLGANEKVAHDDERGESHEAQGKEADKAEH
ncbi:MAG TPA: hypothetical protein VKX17_16580 [Planctomycetota bacterium]|nr:hypothetical protein [Planctomycetota bacterium]